MTTVEIQNLWKTWGDFSAIRGANLTIEEGEFLTLLGESGCGKTTTLRCIAGLETPTSGRISFNGAPVYDSEARINTPPERRHLGMVFQSYALWPHLTIQENVEFPLKSQRVKKVVAKERSMSALALVGLDHLASRSATTASGGQQQRVAVARALVTRPAVMLYDEPLSNLDPSLRRSMRDSIVELHEKGGTTSVYVTHDLEEAMHLSDRVVVMQHGLLEQVDVPERIYSYPRTSYVAAFVGFENVLPATTRTLGSGTVHAYIPSLDVNVDVPMPSEYRDSHDHALAVRALNVRLIPRAGTRDGSTTPPAAMAQGTISRVSYLGAKTEFLVDVAQGTIKAALSERESLAQKNQLRPGTPVWIELDASMCRVVESSGAPQDGAAQDQSNPSASIGDAEQAPASDVSTQEVAV